MLTRNVLDIFLVIGASICPIEWVILMIISKGDKDYDFPDVLINVFKVLMIVAVILMIGCAGIILVSNPS